MAFIGFSVPADAALLLEGIEVPGDRESASDMHITIVHLGKDVPMVNMAKAMMVAHSVAQSFGPMSFLLGKVSTFPKNDDGSPVICPVDSPPLQALHSALKSELSRFGIPFSDKFPVFRPHVTLSYFRESPPDFVLDVDLPVPVPFSVSELCMWGGNAEGLEVVRISLPLSLTLEQRVAARMVR